MNKEQPKWEKEFDKQKLDTVEWCESEECCDCSVKTDKIKQFISKTIQAEREEIGKMINNEKDILKSEHNNEWYINFDKIIKIIKRKDE